MARLWSVILLGVVTIAAILLITSDDNASLQETFEIQAVYESGDVEVSYLDKSGKTESAVLEILGMRESFQKKFTESEFVERIPFGGQPTHGWKAHPVVLEIEHSELGHVQLKTEIHSAGQPIPETVYSQR